MTISEWEKEISKIDNQVAEVKFNNEIYKMRAKSRRRDEFANKVADLVVKKLNKKSNFIQ